MPAALKAPRPQPSSALLRNGGAFALNAKFLLQINFSINHFEPINNFKVLF